MLISRNHENLCLRLMEHAGKVIFGQGFPQICPILDHKNIFFGTFLRNRRTKSVLQSCMSHLKTCRPSKMMNIFYFQYFLSYSGLNFLFWPSVTRSLYGVPSTVATWEYLQGLLARTYISRVATGIWKCSGSNVFFGCGSWIFYFYIFKI